MTKYIVVFPMGMYAVVVVGRVASFNLTTRVAGCVELAPGTQLEHGIPAWAAHIGLPQSPRQVVVGLSGQTEHRAMAEAHCS